MSLARALGHPRPEILGGARGLVALARDLGSDVVLSAIVGGAGLLPTMAAIEAGKAVAIANKEPLVMAGSLMTAAARRHKAPLLPVDSEHSAIYQCLEGQQRGPGPSHPAHRLGRAVPAPAQGRDGRGHRRGCAQSSDVEDGSEDHRRLRHPHEQRARSHRGALALRPSLRPGAGGGAPAVHHSFHGRVRGRIGHRPARGGRHGNSHPLRPQLSRPPPVAGGAAGPDEDGPARPSRSPMSIASRAWPSPARLSPRRAALPPF